jgi:hypothetical protein
MISTERAQSPCFYAVFRHFFVIQQALLKGEHIIVGSLLLSCCAIVIRTNKVFLHQLVKEEVPFPATLA